MPEFDIDKLKKNWQEQEVPLTYAPEDILTMLNRRSRNYVKYIFWISLLEFLIFLTLSLWYLLWSEEESSFLRILARVGVSRTMAVQRDFEHLYFVMKIISLMVSGYFLAKFYRNYRRIKVEENLKKLMEQIVRFRWTVNQFIAINLLLIILFIISLSYFISFVVRSQNIAMSQSAIIGLSAGMVVALLLCLVLLWAYYRLVYGIMMKRLEKNLRQLEKIEAGSQVNA